MFSNLRIGHGYDVHRLVEGRRCIIGGVDIPYERGLLGHSDADVLAHALADAILGACRGGDIGKLFPDTDPAYEGADSMVLLARVMDYARELGFEFVDAESKHFLRGVGNGKQGFGRFVDAFVGGLCGQNDRYQQRVGVLVVEFAARIGIALIEYVHNLHNFFFAAHYAFTPPAPAALGALSSSGQRGRGLKSRSLT